ncbi:MAG: alcohol dehydrogenase catalytic domain-containing protein [Candidatus Marinimicrobia bacterium]|jgi:threonine dehydrogenase-like Zn-dependent dehydrogenase|nr:alcohol dehydrogenase catalytic domain-containing protein [Candidatus Neomarinimicrobiota bacterium]
MEIREILLVGPKTLKESKYELNKIKSHDVLVKVAVCGVCPTEFPVYEGLTIGKPGVSFRYNKYPCFLGHEVSGVVIDVGKKVKTISIGDRVSGIPYTRSGFSTHVVEHEKYWRRINESINIEYALGEPVLCVENIINRSQPTPNSKIAIIGDGFISFLIISSLISMGIRNIILIGHHDSRLKIGKTIGADITINSNKEDPYWVIRNHIGENLEGESEPWLLGLDIVIDTTGSMSALQLGASLLKPKQRAKLVLTGFYSEEPFSLGHYLVNRGPEIVVAFPSQSLDIQTDLNIAMNKMNRNIYPMEKLVSHAFSFNNINDAFRMAKERENGYVKGVFCPDFDVLKENNSIKIVK